MNDIVLIIAFTMIVGLLVVIIYDQQEQESLR